MLAVNPFFNNGVVVSIVVAGVLVGMATYPSLQNTSWLRDLDTVVQSIFSLDCLMKIFAEGRYPTQYWLVWYILLFFLQAHGSVLPIPMPQDWAQAGLEQLRLLAGAGVLDPAERFGRQCGLLAVVAADAAFENRS